MTMSAAIQREAERRAPRRDGSLGFGRLPSGISMREHRAAARHGAQAQRRVEHAREAAHDRQAEAEALALGRLERRRVVGDLVELLEDALLLVRADTQAGIPDLEAQPSPRWRAATTTPPSLV